MNGRLSRVEVCSIEAKLPGFARRQIMENSFVMTSKNILTIFVVVLFSFSCSYKKEIKKPAGLIEEDKMVLILSDLSLTEAALNNNPLPVDSLKQVNVLKSYEVSRQAFDSSFYYYSQDPPKLKEIYGKVLENLNRRQ